MYTLTPMYIYIYIYVHTHARTHLSSHPVFTPLEQVRLLPSLDASIRLCQRMQDAGASVLCAQP